MGQKSSRSVNNDCSSASLNANEKRRLAEFLDAKGCTSTKLNKHDIHNLWKDVLVPDLIQSYIEFIMKHDISKKNVIGIDEFATLYITLVRGDYEDQAALITSVTCSQSNPENKVVSYKALCKYLSDLLESFYLGLKKRNDKKYKSWTDSKEPDRLIIEQLVKGICSDLKRNNDNVQLQDIEAWLRCTGLVSTLHTHVLGSMYNLQPEESESTVFPLAIWPTSNTYTMLNPSQVVLLNSLLPTDQRFEWRSVFSTKTHGESYSKFVGSIINQGPLILLIKSDDKCIFGGYISDNIAPGPRWAGTSESFLFRLYPSVEVYQSTGYNDHYVYLNMNQSSLPNGLGMGGQFSYWGLWIDSNYGDGETSESCTTFKNYKMLATKKKFRIVDLEVWAVGEAPPTAEEKGERSILKKDPTAAHILEMAGRQQYSKDLSKAPREK